MLAKPDKCCIFTYKICYCCRSIFTTVHVNVYSNNFVLKKNILIITLWLENIELNRLCVPVTRIRFPMFFNKSLKIFWYPYVIGNIRELWRLRPHDTIFQRFRFNNFTISREIWHKMFVFQFSNSAHYCYYYYW